MAAMKPSRGTGKQTPPIIQKGKTKPGKPSGTKIAMPKGGVKKAAPTGTKLPVGKRPPRRR